MPTERKPYTKIDLQRVFESVALTLSPKANFHSSISDAELFRARAAELISFIEEKGGTETGQIFSGLLEVLLMLRIRGAQDVFRFFRSEKRTAAAHARQIRGKKSRIIDTVISERLSRLYVRKPIRRKTDMGAATDILEEVNADLKLKAIEPLGKSALTKRIKRIKTHTSGQTSD
jgi:hypothetical protein